MPEQCIALLPINQDHYAALFLINSRGAIIPKAEWGALTGSPVITGCEFINNSADYGGAMYFSNESAPVISGCFAFGNRASDAGGSICTETRSNVILTNCTFSNNQSPEGGGIELRESFFTITNTIISFSRQGSAISYGGPTQITLTYSDIYGNAGGDWIGIIEDQLGINGNINNDPLYVDTTRTDCYLTANSPCIDAGDPDSPPDPDGTTVDMGGFYFNQATGVHVIA